MVRAPSATVEKESLSHNLLGQRLGRKGRDTRERIIAATEKLLAGRADTAISPSAVAREASLGERWRTRSDGTAAGGRDTRAIAWPGGRARSCSLRRGARRIGCQL